MNAHLHLVSILTATIVTCSALAGCDGIMEYPLPCGDISILYEWNEAAYPGFAKPEGMTALLYPAAGGDYWRFETGPDGGRIAPERGKYIIAAMNNDTHSVIWDGYGAAQSLYAYTHPGSVLMTVDDKYRGAEPPETTGQPLRQQPDPIFVAGTETLVTADPVPTEILMYPRLFTPLYTVIVTDIANIASLSSASMSVSGLAAGKYLLDARRMDTPVTMPASLAADGDNRLSGKMYCFGPAVGCGEHTLCIYAWLRDGQKKVYRFDVSDIVNDHADSLFVTITVSGLELPDTAPGPDLGGMDVDVDNWNVENIELSN